MRVNGQKMSEEEFLSILEEEYKGKITCIDKYINSRTPIKFYCHEKDENGNEHGKFEKKPYQLLRMHRHCPICMGIAHFKPSGYWKIKEHCEEFAKTCKNKFELQTKSSGCYTASLENGWLDEFQEKYFDGQTHYRNPNDKIHCIYIYLIHETHSCYVGRTSSIERRDRQHRCGWTNSKHEKCFDNLYKHCEENNVSIPKPIIIEEGLNAIESQEREEYWLNYYKNEGWNTINKAVVGKNKGSLGATLKWIYEKCKEEASKYKSKQDFRNHNQGAYNAAYREKWLNEFFPELACKPNGYWNVLENCQKEALKFTGPKDMIKGGSGGCYNSIKKHGWKDLIRYKSK